VEMSGRGEWRVIPPSYRYDVGIEADLIEEVARIHGYGRLPLHPEPVQLPAVRDSESRLHPDRLIEALVHRGYQEVVTYSFVEPALQARLAADERPIDLDNPIAAQLAQMRTTLWSSLLPAWQYNVQRQQARLRLFELGLRFRRDPADSTKILQEAMIAGLISGPAHPEQWGEPVRVADFYDLKADVEALLALGGAPGYTIEAGPHPALHPGQSAVVRAGGKVVGWLGKAHPSLAALIDVKAELPLLFELNLDFVSHAQVPAFSNLSEFPLVRRDLALQLADHVSGAELLECVRRSGELSLRDVFIFDVYRGQGLQSGFKSIALGLIFQEYSRTLTDTEVDLSISRLQERLQRELGATVRG
jgi:phenylalanyl-tRNA synthetase beta chain